MSERRSCQLLALARSTARYQAKRKEDGAVEALWQLAQKHPGIGYGQLHQRMRLGGWVINRKRVYRLYKMMELGKRKTKPRKRIRGQGSPLRATRANQVWAVDFMADRLDNGQAYRLLTMVDCHTRECLAIDVNLSMSSARLVAALSRVAAVRGLPETIVSDNGPELTGFAVKKWAERNEVKLHYIDPGRPTQNGFVESFNSIVRRECWDLRSVDSITEARLIVQEWREDYNHRRPHGSLGNVPPGAFARITEWCAFRGILDDRATRSDNGLMEKWKTLRNAFPTFPQAPPLRRDIAKLNLGVP